MFVCPECGAAQPMAGPCPADRTEMLSIGDDLLLGTAIGAYRVARLLGIGGMGRVYKGVHPTIGSRVAVKVLSRECSDRKDLVERFFAEAKAVNLIRHESIVNVLDLSVLPGCFIGPLPSPCRFSLRRAGAAPLRKGRWLLSASTHDATGLRADRRPSAACKKQTCRTIRCNSLSLAPCSSCGWVYATAGAIEYPTPCRQRGTRTTRTGRLYPAAEKAQAGKASTARRKAATSIVARRELRIIGTS